MTSTSRSHSVALGVALILTAGFTISVQDVIFKLFSQSLTLWQLFTLRALITLPLFAGLGLALGQRDLLSKALSRWVLIRAAFMSSTFTLFYAALPFISLSTAGAANYTAPLFITLLSAFMLGEPVRKLGWVAVVLGFIGVLILLQPGGDAFSGFALFPLVGAVFYALSHIVTRAKCQSVSLLAMALAVNLVMLSIGLVGSLGVYLWSADALMAAQYPSLLGNWKPVDASTWAFLFVLAIMAVGIGMLLAGAYKVAPPAIIGTFEYTYLVFVAFWDLLVFTDPPNSVTILGMTLIVMAGLLVIRR